MSEPGHLSVKSVACGTMFRNRVRASRSFSAFLFTRKYLGRISTAAFPYAGLTGIELLCRDQLTGAIGSAAECILAAFVAELVDCCADLRRIWPAREVETMTTGKPTGR